MKNVHFVCHHWPLLSFSISRTTSAVKPTESTDKQIMAFRCRYIAGLEAPIFYFNSMRLQDHNGGVRARRVMTKLSRKRFSHALWRSQRPDVIKMLHFMLFIGQMDCIQTGSDRLFRKLLWLQPFASSSSLSISGGSNDDDSLHANTNSYLSNAQFVHFTDGKTNVHSQPFVVGLVVDIMFERLANGARFVCGFCLQCQAVLV